MSDEMKANLKRAGYRFARVFWITALLPTVEIVLRVLESGSFLVDWPAVRNAFVAGLAMALAKFLRDEFGRDVKVL